MRRGRRVHLNKMEGFADRSVQQQGQGSEHWRSVPCAALQSTVWRAQCCLWQVPLAVEHPNNKIRGSGWWHTAHKRAWKWLRWVRARGVGPGVSGSRRAENGPTGCICRCRYRLNERPHMEWSARFCSSLLAGGEFLYLLQLSSSTVNTGFFVFRTLGQDSDLSVNLARHFWKLLLTALSTCATCSNRE